MQSTDSMQFVSNYQWHFFTELEKFILKLREWTFQQMVQEKTAYQHAKV